MWENKMKKVKIGITVKKVINVKKGRFLEALAFLELGITVTQSPIRPFKISQGIQNVPRPYWLKWISSHDQVMVKIWPSHVKVMVNTLQSQTYPITWHLTH